MEIQEAAPPVRNPLERFDEDYDSAIVHVAWDHCCSTGQRTLLFSFVELLPTELPPPPRGCTAQNSEQLGESSKHFAHISHAVLSARESLSWYLQCRRGTVILPEDGSGPVDEDRLGVETLRVEALGEHPIWPAMLTVGDMSDTIPFCPQWMASPRVHHLVPKDAVNLRGLWSEAEEARARVFVADKLHFDMSAFPEYWGSVHLVAPNPLYRALHTRLQRRRAPAESVLVRLDPRAGKSVRGLNLTLQERERSCGVLDARTESVEHQLLRFNYDHEVGAVKEEVFDQARGMLQVSDRAAYFLKQVHVALHLVHPMVVDPGDGDPFEVPRSSSDDAVGAAPDREVPSARARIAEGLGRRKRKRRALAQGQYWFSGQKDEARDVLRGIIHPATKEVMLVDPYFGAHELYNFAMAVGREDVVIRLLTAAATLKKTVKTPRGRVEVGEQLRGSILDITGRPRMNPLEVRVMLGKSPAIHDRFVVADDRVWHVGSSFNTFGSRGTLMLAVPDPEEVSRHILAVWKQAEDLHLWWEKRQKRRGGASGG